MSKDRDITGVTLASGADFNDVLVGDFTYGGGSMTLGSDYTGTIPVSKVSGKITLNDGVNITGGIDNTSGTPNSATLTLKGSSDISGAIGGTSPLASVSIFNKAASVDKFGGVFNSKTLTLGLNHGMVTFDDRVYIKDLVAFTARCQSLILNKNSILTGGAIFAAMDSRVIVNSVAGDNTFTGALTTTTNNTGTLAITGGANTVTIASAVGVNVNALSSVTVADSTNVIFSSAVYTNTLTIGSGNVSFDGDVIISGKLIVTGLVAFSSYVDLKGAEVDISGGGDITFDRKVDITDCKFIGDLEHIHFLGDVIGEWQVQGLGFVDSDE